MNEILNGNQLWNLADKHGLPLKAIYLSGNIPPSAPDNGMYIFNMDRHPNGKGTHWICAYCDNSGCVYFDSFGFPPNVPIIDFLKRRYGTDFEYNHREIQDYYHDSCGEWCLAFLIAMKKNVHSLGLIGAANAFLSSFDGHTLYNELILRNMDI